MRLMNKKVQFQFWYDFTNSSIEIYTVLELTHQIGHVTDPNFPDWSIPFIVKFYARNFSKDRVMVSSVSFLGLGIISQILTSVVGQF